MSAPPNNHRALPDVAVAAALAVVAFLLYRNTWSDFLYDDGPLMAASVAMDSPEAWYHALVVPLGRLARACMGAVDGVAPMKMVSSIAGAVALVCTFLFLRSLGVARAAALATVLVIGASPALWYQATATEVHALHAAAMALVALVVVRLPWGRRGAGWFALCVLATAAGVVFTVLAHRTSALAGAGFLVLAASTSARAGAPRPWPVWVLGVGPLLVAAAYFGGQYGSWIVGAPTRLGNDRALAVFDFFVGSGLFVTAVAKDWFAAWPFVPLLLAGFLLVERSRRREVLFLVLCGVLPPLVVIASMGIPSRGGYAIGSLPFVALPLALGVQALAASRLGRRTFAVVALGVCVHVALAFAYLRDSTDREYGRLGLLRAQDVAEILPDGGWLVSCDVSGQLVTSRVPSVQELPLLRVMPRFDEREAAVAVFGKELEALVRAAPGRVAWDRSWHTTLPQDLPAIDRYLIPFEAFVREHFACTEFSFADRSYLRLAPLVAGPP